MWPQHIGNVYVNKRAWGATNWGKKKKKKKQDVHLEYAQKLVILNNYIPIPAEVSELTLYIHNLRHSSTLKRSSQATTTTTGTPRVNFMLNFA